MKAIHGFWKRSLLNKLTLLMSFSLVFCCCGWTGRIGQEQNQPAVAPPGAGEVSESPAHRQPDW